MEKAEDYPEERGNGTNSGPTDWRGKEDLCS